MLKLNDVHSAQWLRDTANQVCQFLTMKHCACALTTFSQFAHYHSLLGVDRELADLVKAVINNEAKYVKQYPYCGAFQPPPESGLSPSVNDWATNVIVNP